MAQNKYGFTNVASLTAEAIGTPGNRTFRISAASGSSSATVWIEKEQLFQLSLAIKQLQSSLATNSTPALPSSLEAPPLTKLDLTPNKIVLSYSESAACFIIEVSETQGQQSTTLKLWVSEKLVKDFSTQAMQVCYAGRPLCQLCGSPMDSSGHRCPMVNGHSTETHIP